MKKLIATLVIGTMILSMASCGKTETHNEASVESSAVSSEAVTTKDEANAIASEDSAVESASDAVISVDTAENASDASTSVDTSESASDASTGEETVADAESDSPESGEAVLEDGCYYSSLTDSTEFDTQVVKSIEFKDDVVVIEAAFSHFIGEDWDNMIQLENAVYTIPVSPDAEYIVGSGEDEPEKMTKEEFIKYISGLMNSGLSFDVTIEDGVAVGFGIWS